MATSVIYNKTNGLAIVSDKQKTVRIKEVKTASISVSDILPFRIKFTNIGIRSYNPNNPAPIGLAIIGVNNYIL